MLRDEGLLGWGVQPPGGAGGERGGAGGSRGGGHRRGVLSPPVRGGEGQPPPRCPRVPRTQLVGRGVTPGPPRPEMGSAGTRGGGAGWDLLKERRGLGSGGGNGDTGDTGNRGRGWGTRGGHWGHWDRTGTPGVGTGALGTGWAVGGGPGDERGADGDGFPRWHWAHTRWGSRGAGDQQGGTRGAVSPVPTPRAPQPRCPPGWPSWDIPGALCPSATPPCSGVPLPPPVPPHVPHPHPAPLPPRVPTVPLPPPVPPPPRPLCSRCHPHSPPIATAAPWPPASPPRPHMSPVCHRRCGEGGASHGRERGGGCRGGPGRARAGGCPTEGVRRGAAPRRPGLEAEGACARVGGLLVSAAAPQRPGGTRRGAAGGCGHLWHLWGRGRAPG